LAQQSTNNVTKTQKMKWGSLLIQKKMKWGFLLRQKKWNEILLIKYTSNSDFKPESGVF
jgi:hypothetical protein